MKTFEFKGKLYEVTPAEHPAYANASCKCLGPAPAKLVGPADC